MMMAKEALSFNFMVDGVAVSLERAKSAAAGATSPLARRVLEVVQARDNFLTRIALMEYFKRFGTFADFFSEFTLLHDKQCLKERAFQAVASPNTG